jgi:hypothetical protein
LRGGIEVTPISRLAENKKGNLFRAKPFCVVSGLPASSTCVDIAHILPYRAGRWPSGWRRGIFRGIELPWGEMAAFEAYKGAGGPNVNRHTNLIPLHSAFHRMLDTGELRLEPITLLISRKGMRVRFWDARIAQFWNTTLLGSGPVRLYDGMVIWLGEEVFGLSILHTYVNGLRELSKWVRIDGRKYGDKSDLGLLWEQDDPDASSRLSLVQISM